MAELAQVVRVEVLTLREREYVAAAHVISQSRLEIAVRHILPSDMASVIVLAALQVAATINAESALSSLRCSGSQAARRGRVLGDEPRPGPHLQLEHPLVHRSKHYASRKDRRTTW